MPSGYWPERSQWAVFREARVDLDLERNGRAFKVDNSWGKGVEVRRDLTSPGSEEIAPGSDFLSADRSGAGGPRLLEVCSLRILEPVTFRAWGLCVPHLRGHESSCPPRARAHTAALGWAHLGSVLATYSDGELTTSCEGRWTGLSEKHSGGGCSVPAWTPPPRCPCSHTQQGQQGG